MKCPLCGCKLAVVEVRNTSDNTVIRRRRCKNEECKGLFYTREIEVDYEDVKDDFMSIQNAYKKQHKDKKKGVK